MHGEAERVVTGLPEPQLQQGRPAGRHLHCAEHRVVLADQDGIRCMRRDAQRRVRNRHGDAVHADREVDAEGLVEFHDGLDHALPLVVRLGAGQQQERVAVTVGEAVEQQRRVLVGGEPVALEGHHRTTAAVVEQLVEVERGDDGVVVGGQVLRQQPLCAARVDEAAHRDEHDRGPCGRLVRVGLEPVEL